MPAELHDVDAVLTERGGPLGAGLAWPATICSLINLATLRAMTSVSFLVSACGLGPAGLDLGDLTKVTHRCFAAEDGDQHLEFRCSALTSLIVAGNGQTARP